MFHIGTYVVHKKLAELGSGEIIKAEMSTISIRFASGIRNFSESHVGVHLEKTTVAPILPPPAATRKRKAVAKKPAAVKAAAAAKPAPAV